MNPSSEDRFLSALAHLTALGFGNLNFVPTILWSENRKKSAALRFQVLQAFGYQTLGYTLWAIGVLLLVVLFYLGLLLVSLIVPQATQNETVITVFSLAIVVILFGTMGLYLLIPVIGAVLCGLGKDFRYPWLGNRLARALGYDPHNPAAPLNADFEERFAAAMGHFSVILPIWGLLAPAWLWITHKSHSSWLKFQSAQTTLYQIFVNVIYFGSSFGSLLAGIAIAIFFGVTSDGSEWSFVVGLLAAAFLMSCTMLILPLFHILGQWAGLQTLLGRDFKYPLLGRWMEKRAPRPANPERAE